MSFGSRWELNCVICNLFESSEQLHTLQFPFFNIAHRPTAKPVVPAGTESEIAVSSSIHAAAGDGDDDAQAELIDDEERETGVWRCWVPVSRSHGVSLRVYSGTMGRAGKYCHLWKRD